MFSKRSEEGVVLIDHRNSPGVSQEFIHQCGLDAPAVPGGHTFESAMVVCHHCCCDVILNPNRSRERGYCMSCDHYICDRCTALRQAGEPCVPYQARMAMYYEAMVKGQLFAVPVIP